MGPAGIVAAGLLYQPRSLHTLGSIYKNDHWHVVFNSRYLPAGQKAISFGQKRTPTDYMVLTTYCLARYLGSFGAYLVPQGPK